MSEANPFQADSTPIFQDTAFSQEERQAEVVAVLQEVSHSLAQTKPWVRFLSLLGFLGTAVTMVVVTIGSLVSGPTNPADLIVMIPICVLFYLIPSILLWNYASRIGDFLRGANPGSFSTALAAQKLFWKYLGILVLIIVIIYGVVIGIAGLVLVLDLHKLP